MSYRAPQEFEREESSGVRSSDHPTGGDMGLDEDQGYESQCMPRRSSQVYQFGSQTYGEDQHNMHQVLDTYGHPYSPVSPTAQFTPSQWSEHGLAQWNPLLHGPQGYAFHYSIPTGLHTNMSARQGTNLTLETDIPMSPHSPHSPGYLQPPSGFPPSASTLVDSTAPFLDKLQSPLSPVPTQAYSLPAYPASAAIEGIQMNNPQHLQAYHSAARRWKDAHSLEPGSVPQKMYKPQAANDRKRYIEEIGFVPPIEFRQHGANHDGISVHEALNGHLGNLVDRDEEVFTNCGPSVSIRLNWPGYEPWSKQIPTKNWKSVPGPITRQKLAKQVARRIDDFIRKMQAMEHIDMDEDSDARWRVGTSGIQLHDLELVSLHQVSKGSWQPHLRVINLPYHHYS
ncbi:hypothetical protein GLOTRDRAFT_138182 [Gloeophyllum trabeum ATCC 11539]|uniref:Uncharacterized protein n=1 Tax=Gloeophyllum trabeum (strain ATCC 11539 / FP-39264 / Madison 617) TaxID=670483 RepID=S7Q8Z2_GLOTA|nr:uncharacterized protein GLOTRDRAFT_138182 [Gloeophyllum trabeum ATCC 11539]EPQ56456.1 hypothetical protein GLOTRDRAFT_138182 [Gloeophyllum trabeum ATCC 11539]